LPSWSPAAQWRHVGFHPGLVEEDETLRVDTVLMALPTLPLTGNVWPILLGGENAFFYSSDLRPAGTPKPSGDPP